LIDISKELILQLNKNNNEYKDVTEKVDWYEQSGKSYTVKYNTSETIYHQSFANWIVLNNPISIEIKNKLIFIEGNLAENVVSVLAFENWYKIFYANGYANAYFLDKITFSDDITSLPEINTMIEYLKEISRFLSVDEGQDFLYKQLDKLKVFEGCLLEKLLTKSIKQYDDNTTIITPFSINKSQKIAVENAMKSDLSIIQGPPGTGKTQTILNIIANCLYRNKTVAVLSGNNEAIKNVYKKLEKEGYGYLNAVLGNLENIDHFFEKETEYVSVSEQRNDIRKKEQVYRRYTHLQNTCLEHTVNVAKLSQKIDDYKVEKQINDAEYCISEHCVPKALSNKEYTAKKLLELASILEVKSSKEVTSFFNRVRFLFRFGIIRVKNIANHQQESIDYLKNKYYTEKIRELDKEKAEKEKFLQDNNFDELDKNQQKISKELLNMVLQEKYIRCRQYQFSKSGYKNEFKNFVKRYPIIYSTTHAIRSCSGKEYLYDYAIIDESSQVDLVTAVIALSCAKRVVLVGDEKQLPHVVKEQLKDNLNLIFQKYQLPDSWNYVTHNILRTINEICVENVPNTLLNEHYRCDPQIIGFCNKRFYNNKLVIHTTHSDGNGVSVIKHGSHFCRGRTNERQIDIIDKEILPDIENSEIGVIAPYRAQVELLKTRFANKGLEIDTVHKFQGKERDYIILSTVSNKVQMYEDDSRIDFLNNPNLLNVAISRAKDKLYILASEEILNQKGSLLRDMSKYYEYYCSETKIYKTNVYSVFDLMYDDYAPILEETKKKLLNISEFQSENIIATIIKEICDSDICGAIDFKHNYPLRYVVKPQAIGDRDDRTFVSNIKTHCDFVIYSKLNKEILLVVEVDGSQHEEEIQASRDRKKDRVLCDAGIKILRLPTTTIECKEKIINALLHTN